MSSFPVHYRQRISVIFPENEYLFPSSAFRHYDGKTIFSIFRNVLRYAGYSHGGRSKGMRIHDFRHTCAVHCLRNRVLAGEDLSALLPALSAYLGHADLRGKNRKTRYVPVMGKTAELLASYLKENRLLDPARAGQPLFFNRQKNRLTRMGVSYINST